MEGWTKIITQLSRIRHDNLLCKQVDKIRSAQKNLEENAEKLTEMVYGLQEGAWSTILSQILMV